LRRRLEPPLGQDGERDGEVVRLEERRPVVGLGRAEGGGEQDRFGARGAEGQKVDQPAAERARVKDIAPASTAHSSPCE
jgi:hypothetical protein